MPAPHAPTSSAPLDNPRAPHPRLFLVKHGSPVKTPDQPPSTWPLSEAGRSAVNHLASRMLDDQPRSFRVFSSPELKARQTAELICTVAGSAPATVLDALAEHDRSSVGLMATPDFVASMALLFKEPSRRVLGAESAEVALDRFDRGVQRAMEDAGDHDVVIATHGTVIALWLAAFATTAAGPVVTGYDLWRKMPNPSAAIVDSVNGRRIYRVLDTKTP